MFEMVINVLYSDSIQKLGTSFLRVLRFEKNRRERIRGYRDIFNVELIFQFTTRNRNKIRHKS